MFIRSEKIVLENERMVGMKKLNVENPFFEFMGSIGDVMLVNILFLIFSIPIVTIGASYTAMYRTFGDLREGKTVFRSFFTAWKAALGRTVPAWIFLLLAGGILVFDITFLVRAGSNGIWALVGMVTGCLLLLWSMVFCYLFPVVAGSEAAAQMRAKEMVSRSLYLAVRNLPYTLVMVVLNSIPAVCMILGDFYVGMIVPIYVIVGFGATAYLNRLLLDRCSDLG